MRTKPAFTLFLILCGFYLTFAHGDTDIRISELSEQIQSEPNNPALYFDRGILYQSHNHFNEAFFDFQMAKSLDPEFAPVNARLSELCLANGLGKLALMYSNELLATDDRDVESLRSRARAYSFLGQYDLALADYQHAIDIGGVGPDYYFEIADMILEAKSYAYSEAVAWYREGLKTYPMYTGFRERIVDLELEAGHIDEALRELDILISLSARKENWYKKKGDILFEDNRTTEALAAYQEAQTAIERLSSARKNTDYMRKLIEQIDSALMRF